jgi:hypothetical protein
MKTLLLALLALSAVANAVFALRHTRSPESSMAPTLKAPAPPSAPQAVPSVEPEIWARLAADDLAAAEDLITAGFPADIVRALVRAQINEQFRRREDALYREVTYWRFPFRAGHRVPVNPVLVLDLEREKRAMLQRYVPSDNATRGAPALDFLSQEKRVAVQLLREDFAALRGKLIGSVRGAISSAENQELNYLMKAERDELTQLLTPAELAEYDLRFSPEAYKLRRLLDAFEPTEAEFRALAPFIEKRNSELPLDTEKRIKEFFGEERAAHFKRSRDVRYRSLLDISRTHKIPQEKTLEAYAWQQRFKDALSERRRAPDAAARASEINRQAFAEAEENLVRIVGRDAFEQMRRELYFLRSLQRN